MPARAGPLAPSAVDHVATAVLHHAHAQARLHRALPSVAPLARTSDALHFRSPCLVTVLLVRPFVREYPTTTTSADFSLRASPSPFQARGEISPGKSAILHRTVASFTPPRLDHKSFAAFCLLALLGSASDEVCVPRLAVSLHASFPRSVTLTQLRFTSLAVVSLREDLHLQDRAHAGRSG